MARPFRSSLRASGVPVKIKSHEKPARERLRHLLKRDARVELVKYCAGGAALLNVMQDEEQAGRPVDVLLLDVQMPELDGFGMSARLVEERGSENLPVAVFVTPHDAYALRTFEAHAIDYLLKPFSDERFQATLDRAVRHVRAGLAHTLRSRMQAMLARIAAGGQWRPLIRSPCTALDRIVVKGVHRVRPSSRSAGSKRTVLT